MYEKIFDAVSINLMDEKFAQMSHIKTIFKKALKFLGDPILTKLFILMDHKKTGAVSK